VIVCSILHQQELALTLGADAFMHKPISRGDFLAALDRFFPPRGSTIGSSSE
jgi:DNA-binding response OmpR family regulator